MFAAGFVEIGGYDQLYVKYLTSMADVFVNDSCGLPREDAFHIMRDPIDSDQPWPGTILGITIIGTWYWCTDQVKLHPFHSFLRMLLMIVLLKTTMALTTITVTVTMVVMFMIRLYYHHNVGDHFEDHYKNDSDHTEFTTTTKVMTQ